jgi:hypothetical protein
LVKVANGHCIYTVRKQYHGTLPTGPVTVSANPFNTVVMGRSAISVQNACSPFQYYELAKELAGIEETVSQRRGGGRGSYLWIIELLTKRAYTEASRTLLVNAACPVGSDFRLIEI